ncbi:hypothetical protein KHA80_18985 [Anaerobacillus sp. HL2]|nr:hypothetical protein KHA80_18985 [Anaerobacillus sp. HL2]
MKRVPKCFLTRKSISCLSDGTIIVEVDQAIPNYSTDVIANGYIRKDNSFYTYV